MKCHHCDNLLQQVFLDLGFAPPSNSYLSAEQMGSPEKYYPLKLMVCEECWLVQTADNDSGEELFQADYAYFSSVSTSWLDHAARYVEMITSRLNLDAGSFVVEVASNDGYLLKNFVAKGIPCLGIEPTVGTAAAAGKLGIPVLSEFFGLELAQQLVKDGRQADLIVGNNVYAHVPDINDFTAGLRAALRPGGTITLEFPHLMMLINENQFDTVYHEHYSYLSLQTVERMFRHAGLRVCDVEQLSTHGGSLRVYGCHVDDPRDDGEQVAVVLRKEREAGLRELERYLSFQCSADRIKDDLLAFLIEKKRQGKSVAAYGAAAKGNTLLNYAGVKPDLLSFVCDAASSKQNKFMPGSHIPILSPDMLAERRPDYVVILPWNIADEVMQQQSGVREWGGQFVVSVPRLEVF